MITYTIEYNNYSIQRYLNPEVDEVKKIIKITHKV